MSMPVISTTDFTSENMVDETVTKDSPMKQFYRDKTVFVTGGTGSLGILFVEKLLRCKAKTVYVLVRPKKNKSPVERTQEIFAGPVFTKLKRLDPDYMKRIQLIEGDTYRADLGISDVDRKEIVANVEIVVHAAADVRFDKSLQELCFTNVRGTKAITLLAEQMTKLIVFAYISTAFSQFYRDKIEEKFYPPPCDPDEMIRIVEYFDKHQTDELNFLTDKLLRPWENTYVFTKALSEELVRRVAHKFPTIVVRPSIIISTYEDPISGWANNIYGLNGLIFGIGMGFIKVTTGNRRSKNLEVVCADFVTNGTLAAMWNKVNATNNAETLTGNVLPHCDNMSARGAESLRKLDELASVVHITSQDPVTCGSFHVELKKWFEETPSIQSLSRPSITLATPGLMFFLLTIMCHVVPAILYDAFFWAINKNVRLLPVYRKYQDFLSRTAYFANRIWQYDNKNMKRIIETGTKEIHYDVAVCNESILYSMSEEDQRFFPCNIFNFKLLEFLRNYNLGMRVYVAKEPLDNVIAARRRFRILCYVSYVTTTIYYSFLGCLLYLFVHMTGVAYYIKRLSFT